MWKLTEIGKKVKEDNEKPFESSCFEVDLEIGIIPLESIEINGDSANELSENETDLLEKKFDEFLIAAIDEGLSTLGEPVKNALYQHLQNDFGIEKKRIPNQIDKFSDIMHKIFGLSATRLEIKFMKNLNSNIGVSLQWPEYEWPLSKWIITEMSFTEYVCNARKNYGVKCQKAVYVDVKNAGY